MVDRYPCRGNGVRDHRVLPQRIPPPPAHRTAPHRTRVFCLFLEPLRPLRAPCIRTLLRAQPWRRRRATRRRRRTMSPCSIPRREKRRPWRRRSRRTSKRCVRMRARGVCAVCRLPADFALVICVFFCCKCWGGCCMYSCMCSCSRFVFSLLRERPFNSRACFYRSSVSTKCTYIFRGPEEKGEKNDYIIVDGCVPATIDRLASSCMRISNRSLLPPCVFELLFLLLYCCFRVKTRPDLSTQTSVCPHRPQHLTRSVPVSQGNLPSKNKLQ